MLTPIRSDAPFILQTQNESGQWVPIVEFENIDHAVMESDYHTLVCQSTHRVVKKHTDPDQGPMWNIVHESFYTPELVGQCTEWVDWRPPVEREIVSWVEDGF